jgi:hypothetical protein
MERCVLSPAASVPTVMVQPLGTDTPPHQVRVGRVLDDHVLSGIGIQIAHGQRVDDRVTGPHRPGTRLGDDQMGRRQVTVCADELRAAGSGVPTASAFGDGDTEAVMLRPAGSAASGTPLGTATEARATLASLRPSPWPVPRRHPRPHPAPLSQGPHISSVDFGVWRARTPGHITHRNLADDKGNRRV